MKHVLESEYEKLKSQDGASELMRAESGGTSRPLKLILMPSDGYSMVVLKMKTLKTKTRRPKTYEKKKTPLFFAGNEIIL